MLIKSAGTDLAELRTAWQDANLAPLWESPVAHKPGAAASAPCCWAWSTVRPLIEQAIQAVSPEEVERRVLVLADPEASARSSAGRVTTNTLIAAMQILLPGETARPHRHSMSALRFVLEGSGAVTTVDGKDCPMEEGDLVLTPGWCWHEHEHGGSGPIIWLDVLDAPLHRYMGTAVFQPGPVPQLPEAGTAAAAGFAIPGMLPKISARRTDHSPLFRYPYRDAVAAVAAAPVGQDGARRVRYINPMSGAAALPMIDSCLVQIDAGIQTIPFRSTSNAVCTIVEGHGESRIGDKTISWGPKDVFTLPQGNWISHRTDAGTARMFVVSDREVFSRLGLLEEEYGK